MYERELKTLCRALGDVTRLRIVAHLAGQAEVNVTDLAHLLALSQPLVSWHLRILKRAAILTTRKEGRQVFCSLDRIRMLQFQTAMAELVQAVKPASETTAAGRTSLAPPILVE